MGRKGAVSKEEQEFLTHESDLLTLSPTQKSPLRLLLDRSEKFRTLRFWSQNKEPELPIHDRGVVVHTSDKRIERFTTFVIIFAGTVMLITPLWVLHALGNEMHKLATITGFILVFIMMLSYATVAKPLEVLAGTAA